MKCVSREKRCIFQVQRCIFQLERCIIPIWRPPDISGGRQLENEMYISSGNVYFNWRDVYFKYISPVEINIFHLKYTSHSVSGGHHLESEMYISSGKMYISTGEMYYSFEIYISSGEIYISFSKWRPPDRNNTSQQLKYTFILMIIIYLVLALMGFHID